MGIKGKIEGLLATAYAGADLEQLKPDQLEEIAAEIARLKSGTEEQVEGTPNLRHFF
jgi:hypothetical protein